MQKYVDDKCLVALAGALENDELGAAVRLLSRILVGGKPVPQVRARIICQMTEERWSESRDAILEHFTVDGDHITHPALTRASLPSAEKASEPTPGRTGEMPVVFPTRCLSVPSFPQRETPEKISMKRAAYDVAIEIFARSDQSANTARTILSSLLKNWPAGDVYEAIAAADREDFLVDPRSWIVAYLQRNSRPIVAGTKRDKAGSPPPQRKSPRRIVTAETMGVSESTAKRIREQNARLHLDLNSSSADS